MANGQVPTEEMIAYFLQKHPDYEQCESCYEVFNWEKLPDENVLTIQEGRPYGSTTAYETIVVGWECPNCGHRNSL